jgi:hypothetical protein
MVLHMELVLKDVVLQKRNSCLVCLEMRGSAMQAMVGCAFPLLLAPVACLSVWSYVIMSAVIQDFF